MEMDKIPFIDKTKMMIQTEQDTSVYYLITYPHTGFQSSTPKLQTTCSSKEIKQFSAKGSCGQVKKGKRLEGEEKGKATLIIKRLPRVCSDPEFQKLQLKCPC